MLFRSEILPEGTFKIDLPITVAGFCEQTEISKSTVIMSLMKLGIMANINQNIDEETMMVLAEELGITVIAGSVEEEVVEEGIESFHSIVSIKRCRNLCQARNIIISQSRISVTYLCRVLIHSRFCRISNMNLEILQRDRKSVV